MHEFSLMADLLRKIEAIAAESGSQKVVAVRVKLGALSHITPVHFTEHFQTAVCNTVAEGASLEIEQLQDTDDPNAQEILLDSIEVAA